MAANMDPRSVESRSRILREIMARGGRWQIKRPELGEAVGMNLRMLSNHITRMEVMGVLNVIRSSGAWGEGREPNTYVALMSEKTFREKADELHAVWLAQRKADREEKNRVVRTVDDLPAEPKPAPRPRATVTPITPTAPAPEPIGSSALFDELVREGLELDPEELAGWSI